MKQVLSIGRSGSFSKAAKALGIAQPTLSKSIARLEDELGVKLFDRSGWRAQMTPMGEFLVGQAEHLVDEATRLDRNIQLIARGEIGEVKIGLGPALKTRFMPRLAATILRRHPNLRLTIMSEDAVELLGGVKSGAFDLVLLANGPVVGDRGLISFDVMEEPGVAVACAGHPLTRRSRISIAEFAEHPIVGTATSSTATPMLYAMPEIAQLRHAKRPFKPRVITNDLDTTLEMVREGLAIYAGPQHVVQPSLDRGEVVRLDVDWSFTYRAVAAMTPAASLSPILRQVVSYAQAVGAEMLSRNTSAPAGRPIEPTA